MGEAMPEPSLDPVRDPDRLADLVDAVFDDPQVRRGMGWTEADDPSEAMEAIQGLWKHRLEEGWQLFEVRLDDRRTGLVGLGPVDPETGAAWYAIYLLERGRGLGSRLTERFVERGRKAGAKALVGITWAENEASQALLTSQGFELEGEAPYDWARESELTWFLYRRPIETGPAP